MWMIFQQIICSQITDEAVLNSLADTIGTTASETDVHYPLANETVTATPSSLRLTLEAAETFIPVKYCL